MGADNKSASRGQVNAEFAMVICLGSLPLRLRLPRQP